MKKLETTVEVSAKKGASIAADFFNTKLQVETKESNLDYVTIADINSQSGIIEIIKEEYPGEMIIAEEKENNKLMRKNEDCWVIDPIDGTSNFIVGNPFWATSVAVIRDGTTRAATTVAPSLGETYVASREGAFCNNKEITVSEKKSFDEFTVAVILRYGTDMDNELSELLKYSLLHFGDIRRFGSAQLTLAMVAHGSLDACFALQPSPNLWDTVAGVELVRKAGGEVTDVYGKKWSYDSQGIIATNGNVHKQVIEKLHIGFPEYIN